MGMNLLNKKVQFYKFLLTVFFIRDLNYSKSSEFFKSSEKHAFYCWHFQPQGVANITVLSFARWGVKKNLRNVVKLYFTGCYKVSVHEACP